MAATAASAPLRALWPEPASARTAWAPRGAGTDYLAVPSPTRPRLLVPVAVPGADRLLQRHGGGRRTRAGRALWRTVHRVGAARWAPVPRLRVQPAPGGIEDYLAEALGHPVAVGVLLGPPRANLKPVLPVFAADGRVVAFAKVGTSPITAALLATEAAALRRLAARELAHVVTPRLLHHGTWVPSPGIDGHPVLVQSALPVGTSGRASGGGSGAAAPAAAVAEIAAVEGLTSKVLSRTAFWASVQPTGGSWQGVDVSPFARLGELVPSDDELVMGAWHGDLGPWNVARDGHRLEVWDWERFATDVPAGLDAAHWRVQVELGRGTTPATAWPLVRQDVATALKSLQDNEAATGGRLPAGDAAAVTVVACYLLAVWARYRQDAPTRATPALRRRVSWLAELADLTAATTKETVR